MAMNAQLSNTHLHGADGHSLAKARIEGADGVAHDDEAIGHGDLLKEAPSRALGPMHGIDLAHWGCILEHLHAVCHSVDGPQSMQDNTSEQTRLWTVSAAWPHNISPRKSARQSKSGLLVRYKH